ncbi:hypothetical protein AB0N19_40355, partial [Streptomyces sp. NPDC051132]|uniref:hypothetical protein n=1 Tax=Streptomyces sp. NPDC051132 TaxID=3155667 RepID=UPI0034320766
MTAQAALARAPAPAVAGVLRAPDGTGAALVARLGTARTARSTRFTIRAPDSTTLPCCGLSPRK